ncbi:MULTISPECIES: mechanosensitive ion channel family protein [unclassified Arthrobacter]|uniref:mechanosensitive ion channel family protein n=1 Tax=unclassified Arthrobacter TaxID=235627 RepID=UPI001D1508C3|nr:mechanosensitive ion channel domain-containing protein [Arthrobacter sp. zg-Y1110]MCC3291472.1 mechanosensitive ion channel family protein [Arthrobacter sp. zg-Y1110]MCC3301154.1 mechanosensitive ion channel family protein [Arthrobacter sp. zg-Y895]MCC3302401.1 mechanosensitive ion channel family protein [Arthrobacter sp. zg-Y895]UWX83885.1 mechanosensitive ion channel family protein [Arthrobacter sp. zg-Y1110]
MLSASEIDLSSVTVNDFDFSGLIEAAFIVLAATGVWFVARFLINRLVARAQKGYSLLHSSKIKWAQPVMRNLDKKRRAQRADTIGALLRSAVNVSIWTVAIIMVLDAVGINIAPLLASVGIVGIALGFGARELIRDALAGFFITIEDQYGIGDVIEVGDTAGTVQSVGIRITRIIDDRGVIWYIRNGEIAKIGNRSQGTYLGETPAEPAKADALKDGMAAND